MPKHPSHKACVIAMITSVSFQDAQSNAASWYTGLIEPYIVTPAPAWLSAPITDKIGFAIGVVLLLAGAIIITFILLAKQFTTQSVKARRIDLVFRAYPPFVDSSYSVPADAAKRIYYRYYLGVRNLDTQQSLTNVRVQVIGTSRATASVPLTLVCKDSGHAQFTLAPNEMRLLVLAKQEILPGQKWGWSYLPGGPNRTPISIHDSVPHVIQVGAFARDAYYSVKITLEAGDNNRLQISPARIGEHPETEGIRGFGIISDQKVSK